MVIERNGGMMDPIEGVRTQARARVKSIPRVDPDTNTLAKRIVDEFRTVCQ
jgi:hypothetical protein